LSFNLLGEFLPPLTGVDELLERGLCNQGAPPPGTSGPIDG
jgi:hypothetical protein